MEPNLDGAIVILEDEVRRWITPDETGVFRLRPESFLEVATTAGLVEGRMLSDGRVVFTLAGRICRAYGGRIPLRSFLARLAHFVERLNHPELQQDKVFRVDPYGFEAEIDFVLGDESVRLYVETCNGQPKIAQIKAYWFLIARRNFPEAAGGYNNGISR